MSFSTSDWSLAGFSFLSCAKIAYIKICSHHRSRKERDPVVLSYHIA